MRYHDREHAARLLARELNEYRGCHPLVLAIPRGPIRMGRVLADALGGELDVVLVRKLPAPSQPELAIGSVDEDGIVYLASAAKLLRIDAAYLENVRRRQLMALRARRKLYTPGRLPISPTGRIVIVVDDGIATGATMIGALRAIRDHHPAELVAVAAVMSPESYRSIANEADRVVCLQMPSDFHAVGQYFENFSEVRDDEVVWTLASQPVA